MDAVIAAAVVGVVALAVIAVLLRRLSQQGRHRLRADQLLQQLAQCTTALDLARRRADAAAQQALAADQRALAASRLDRDHGDALWGLERLRQQREWSAVAGPSVPVPTRSEAMPTVARCSAELAAAVAIELTVIREQVGTPGQVAGFRPGPDLRPGTALVALRIVSELLYALARRCEDLQVHLGPDADDLVVTVAGEGWEGEDGLAATPALVEAAAHLGGFLSLGPSGEGGMRAVLRLPSGE